MDFAHGNGGAGTDRAGVSDVPPSLPTSQALLSPGTHVETVHNDLCEKLAGQKLESLLPSSLSICTGSLSPSV